MRRRTHPPGAPATHSHPRLALRFRFPKPLLLLPLALLLATGTAPGAAQTAPDHTAPQASAADGAAPEGIAPKPAASAASAPPSPARVASAPTETSNPTSPRSPTETSSASGAAADGGRGQGGSPATAPPDTANPGRTPPAAATDADGATEGAAAATRTSASPSSSTGEASTAEGASASDTPPRSREGTREAVPDPFEVLLQSTSRARALAGNIRTSAVENARLVSMRAPLSLWDTERAASWLGVEATRLRSPAELQTQVRQLTQREAELRARIDEIQALDAIVRSRQRAVQAARGEAPPQTWHPLHLQPLLFEASLDALHATLGDERRLARQRLDEIVSLRLWLIQRAQERAQESATAPEARERLDEARRRLGDEEQRTEAVQQQAEQARRQADEARAEALDAERAELIELLDEAGAMLEGLAIARVREAERYAEIAELEAETARDFESLHNRVEALLATAAGDPSRAERALTMHQRLHEMRRVARSERRVVATRLDEARASRDALAEHVAAARALEEQLLARRGGEERLRDLRRNAATLHVRASDEAVGLSTLRVDRLEATHRLHLETLLWSTHTMDRVTPLLSPEALADRYGLSSRAFDEARANLQDRWLLWTHRLQTWPEQLAHLQERLLSIEGLLGGGRLVVYLALFALLLALFARRRDAGLRWILKALETKPWARRNWRWILKAAELVRDLTAPIGALIALRLIFSQIPADLLSVAFLRIPLEAVLLWVLVLRTLRTCLVPRAARRDAQDQDEGLFGVDLVRLDARTLRLVLLSARILLLYLLFEWVGGAFIALVIGPELIHFQLARLLFWGRLALIYLLLWAWRDTIVESFVALTQIEESRSAELLRAHRDRPYSVLFLFFLAAYLLVRQSIRLVQSLMLGLSLGRRVSNFVFRKRIELASARDEESPARVRADAGLSHPLYQPDLLASEALEVERSDLLVEVHRAWLTWQEEPDAGGAVAIIGERHMGKTTLLRQLARKLTPVEEGAPDHAGTAGAPGETAPRAHAGPALHLTITERIHTPEALQVLLARLFDLENPEQAASWSESAFADALIASRFELVYLDECHNLFVRRIGGFAAIDRFLRIVSLTRHHLFWVLSFNLYAWRYLNRVQDRRHFFRAIVQVAGLREAELRQLIELRNEAAGIEADFGLLARSGSFAGGSNQHYELVRTSEGFFRLLNEFSEGNPGVALVYWARSLRRREDGMAEVTLFHPASDLPLRTLTDQQLFSLTAIAQHENLDARELAAVVNGREGDCRLDINLFLELGLIRLDASRSARLDPRMQRQVLRRLRDANLLYLNR